MRQVNPIIEAIESRVLMSGTPVASVTDLIIDSFDTTQDEVSFKTQEIQSGKVTLWDHTFEVPRLSSN